MNKKKLFIENLLVYGVGGIISQIIPLIMLPIVTRIMPNSSYFGISDLATTVISFGSALAIMGMYDAMYRLFFDKDEEEYQKQICSTALFVTICSSIVVFILMILGKNLIAKYVFGDSKYFYVVYITAMGGEIGVDTVVPAFVGLLLAVVGNYLPKCSQNHTIGIKISWTLYSEENWNATHRFAGKVWVIGGLVIAAGSFLPGSWTFGVLLAVAAAMVILPVVYSYRYYKKEQ